MLELDMIEAVTGRMVTSMYKVLRDEHKRSMNAGLTKTGANEAVRTAIEKLYNAVVLKKVQHKK